MEIKKPIVKRELLSKKTPDEEVLGLDVESALISDLSFNDKEINEVNLYEVVAEDITFQSSTIRELKITDSILKKIKIIA